MTDITVVRNSGLWPGQDIVEPLLTTDAIALHRGRNDLDEGTPADAVTLSLPFTSARCGQTWAYWDQETKRAGKVTGITHRIEINDDGGIVDSTELTIRTPR